MLTAVMMNREEKITEDKKEDYLLAGYDVIDGDGNRTIAPSKQISYAEHSKLQKELDEAKVSSIKLTTAYDTLAKDFEALRAENDELKTKLEKQKKAGV